MKIRSIIGAAAIITASFVNQAAATEWTLVTAHAGQPMSCYLQSNHVLIPVNCFTGKVMARQN